jgi:hypothetical protein
MIPTEVEATVVVTSMTTQLQDTNTATVLPPVTMDMTTAMAMTLLVLPVEAIPLFMGMLMERNIPTTTNSSTVVTRAEVRDAGQVVVVVEAEEEEAALRKDSTLMVLGALLLIMRHLTVSSMRPQLQAACLLPRRLRTARSRALIALPRQP